jgi:hypothetical protein
MVRPHLREHRKRRLNLFFKHEPSLVGEETSSRQRHRSAEEHKHKERQEPESAEVAEVAESRWFGALTSIEACREILARRDDFSG